MTIGCSGLVRAELPMPPAAVVIGNEFGRKSDVLPWHSKNASIVTIIILIRKLLTLHN